MIQEDLAGGGTNTYVLGSGIICMTLGGQPYFLLCDDLGSTREATDIEGSVAESYDYTDFGAPSFFAGNGEALTNSAIGNPLLFRMERCDSETRFGYTGNRYVDFEVGEFITRGGIWVDSRNLGNPRTFTIDNPVSGSALEFEPDQGPVPEPPPPPKGGSCDEGKTNCRSVWHWDEFRWTECLGNCAPPKQCRCTSDNGHTYKICTDGWHFCWCVTNEFQLPSPTPPSPVPSPSPSGNTGW